MRLSISNIAWDVEEDEAVSALLKRLGLNAVDVAPGKYFPKPEAATEEEILRVRRGWSDRGVEVVGMQALLFGTVGLNLFGSDGSRQAMLAHLEAVCRIGGGLGARWLVFGSPKNRDRSGLRDEQVEAVALPFFRKLGDVAVAHGVTICLEPNPSRYGANYMVSSDETAQVVRQVDHPGIQMQLDTGALALNGEDPDGVIERFSGLVGHVHASEPDLVPLGDGSSAHGRVAELLRRHLPEKLVTVEMVATKNEPHLHAIERALQIAQRHYGAIVSEGASGIAV